MRNNTINTIIKGIERGTINANQVPEILLSSFDIARAIVRKNGLDLAVLTDWWEGNPIIEREACMQNPLALQFCSWDNRSNFDFVLDCVTIDGMALEYAAPSMQADYRVCYPAVANNWRALQFCTNRNTDAELVALAVSGDLQALNFVSSSVVWARPVVLEVVKKNGKILKNLRHYQEDKEVCYEAVMNTPLAYAYCKDKKDERLLEMVFANPNAHAMKFIPIDVVVGNKNMAIAIFRTDGHLLKQYPVFQTDYDCCLAALSSTSDAMEYIDIDEIRERCGANVSRSLWQKYYCQMRKEK